MTEFGPALVDSGTKLVDAWPMFVDSEQVLVRVGRLRAQVGQIWPSSPNSNEVGAELADFGPHWPMLVDVVPNLEHRSRTLIEERGVANAAKNAVESLMTASKHVSPERARNELWRPCAAEADHGRDH